MIHLELTKEEKEMLIDILENDLSDLRMEIADTDKMDFREILKKQKGVLKKVLEILRQAE
ncbi:MAG: hypothetical protein HZC52_03460 [Planctomycetes bacterium]|nr:hypothetical protein [Planctomycetota bacterium]